MPQDKKLTIAFISDMLSKKGLLSETQAQEIRIKGETNRARLQMEQEPGLLRRRPSAIDESVSAIEVIASFNFEVEGVEGKELNEDFITEVLAKECEMEYLKIDPLKLNLDTVTSSISRPFAQKYMIVPVDIRNGTVVLAVANPFDTEVVENLTRTTRKEYATVLCSKSDIMRIVREFYGFRTSMVAAQKEMGHTTELGNLEQYVKLKGNAEIDATDQHVVNAVEYLLHYAYDQRASDIHIEPKRDSSHVRMRIDGILHHIHQIPKTVHPSMVSRIKTLSRMDIAEKRRPQDGRIKTEYKGTDVELRISTLPTAFGEKIVIRIFDPQILFCDMSELGFEKGELETFLSFLKKRHGILLVTGPTGSGKTTTLYSSLKMLATPDVNIITVEDPIEMVMEEFNQVSVQPKVGVTFSSTIRTMLRQDPDIIMVGEIRDEEAASNAVQAALTGHLVLSTLHTNDAPSSITRLIDLGVPPFLISSTVLGIMAQRLVRKICTSCKAERQMTKDEKYSLGLSKAGSEGDEDYTVYFGEGCTDCRSTGYHGRIAIFEIMALNDELKGLVATAPDLELIRAAAKRSGMTTLREAALKKVLEGITTPEEMIAVTGS